MGNDNLILDTSLIDLFVSLGNDKDDHRGYELFRRKIRRLESANKRTVNRLLKKAGLLDDWKL